MEAELKNKEFDEETKILNKLSHRDIKATSTRVLVLKTMIRAGCALSIGDLEEALETVDKSTIFRTLTLFHEHRLVHCIDDGSGSLKYAVCQDDCDCSLEKEHVHFYCERCHKTYCFEGLSIPRIILPKNFKTNEANFVFKGVCKNCSER